MLAGTPGRMHREVLCVNIGLDPWRRGRLQRLLRCRLLQRHRKSPVHCIEVLFLSPYEDRIHALLQVGLLRWRQAYPARASCHGLTPSAEVPWREGFRHTETAVRQRGSVHVGPPVVSSVESAIREQARIIDKILDSVRVGARSS